MRDYARATNGDWQAAKQAAGRNPSARHESYGTVVLHAPSRIRACFHLEELTNAYGQRVDTHKFPILGGYWQQPLSEEVNRFSLSGWIVGPKYLERRDQLARVLHSDHDSETPLVLELPSYEPLPVLFVQGKQKESGSRGGIVELNLEFARVLNVQPHIARPDGGAEAAKARQSVLKTLAEDVNRVASAADNAWKEGSGKIASLISKAKASVQLAENAAADLNRNILEVQSVIRKEIQAPGKIVNSLGSTVSTLVAAVQSVPVNAEAEARRLQQYFAGWANAQPPGGAGTARTVRDAKVDRLTRNLLCSLGAIGAAQNLPQIAVQSTQEARALYQQIQGFEDALLEPGGTLLQALEQQRIALREQLRSLGWFALASERTIAVSAPGMSSIALSRQINAEEAGIRARNRAMNAFFISGEVKYV